MSDAVTTKRMHYLPASMLQRLGSWVLDALVFVCVVMVPSTLLSWWLGPEDFTYCEFSGRSESCTITPEALRFTRILFYVLSTVFVVAYSVAVSRRASFGKNATEIIVVDAVSGDRISVPRALGRTLLSIVSVAAFGLGMVVTLTNRERRAAHDFVMRTRVISP